MTTGSNSYSERRQFARHPIKLDASLVLDDGTMLPVQSINISGTGMQIFCNSWVAEEIEPRGIHSHSTSHIRLKIIIELPGEQGKQKLYAYCKILSAQRLSQEEYNLNLVFTSFENGSQSAIDNFLRLYQQKKTQIKDIALAG